MKRRDTKRISRTDWKRLHRMRDAEIDVSEAPELGEDFFKTATLKLPRPKRSVTLRLDPGVVDWFKHQGKGYQTRINAVLQMYVEAQTVK